MAQIRFNIGVPRAGSAAQDAESSREHFRSLRPEAGSAARQAEEARREAQADGAARPARMATLRMRGISEDRSARVTSTIASTDPVAGLTAAQSSATPTFAVEAAVPDSAASPSAQTFPIPASAAQPFADTGAGAPDRVSALPTSLASNPLQTAAAKVRSLFRSMLSRVSSEN